MAAAMQDHFLRNLNVRLPGMARRKPAPRRPEKVMAIDAKAPSQEEAAKKLSLAQKMGLVALPPAKLSQAEWQQVAEQSRWGRAVRASARPCLHAVLAWRCTEHSVLAWGTPPARVEC